MRGVDDLLLLGDFNEAALLHNIRVRYSEDPRRPLRLV